MKIKNKHVIGVTLGDAAGIGPELIIKSLCNEDIRQLATWLIVGDMRVFEQGRTITSLDLGVEVITEVKQLIKEDGNIYFIDLKNLSPDDYELGSLSARSGKATVETLKHIIDIRDDYKLDGIIYGPLNKEAMQRGGLQSQDELHFFADLLESEEGFGEINIMDNLWVTRVTSHVPLAKVSEMITKEKVLDRIKFADKSLIKAGLKQPKIYVSSFNPHSGEGGLLGNEEIDFIIPAVEEAKNEGINVYGPYPSDTIFLRFNKEEPTCLLAMYHDQAQIGLKLLGFNRGVTMSAGLPIVLVTPAHGTAFDIAGQGIADEGATIAAIRMIIRMSSNS